MRFFLIIAAIIATSPAAASEVKLCPSDASIAVWYNAAKNVTSYRCGDKYVREIPGKECRARATGQSYLKDRYVGWPREG